MSERMSSKIRVLLEKTGKILSELESLEKQALEIRDEVINGRKIHFKILQAYMNLKKAEDLLSSVYDSYLALESLG